MSQHHWHVNNFSDQNKQNVKQPENQTAMNTPWCLFFSSKHHPCTAVLNQNSFGRCVIWVSVADWSTQSIPGNFIEIYVCVVGNNNCSATLAITLHGSRDGTCRSVYHGAPPYRSCRFTTDNTVVVLILLGLCVCQIFARTRTVH